MGAIAARSDAVAALAKLLQVHPELRALFAAAPAVGPTVRDVLTKHMAAAKLKLSSGAIGKPTEWWTRYYCTSFIEMFGALPNMGRSRLGHVRLADADTQDGRGHWAGKIDPPEPACTPSASGSAALASFARLPFYLGRPTKGQARHLGGAVDRAEPLGAK